MAYRPLPQISLTASADTSGINPGNYSNYFSSAILGVIKVPYFEWYHATVTGVPGGASAVIYQNNIYRWGATAPGVGGVSEYAPSAGMLMEPGYEITFAWSTGSGTKPVVTLFFRFDADDPANQANL